MTFDVVVICEGLQFSKAFIVKYAKIHNHVAKFGAKIISFPIFWMLKN